MAAARRSTCSMRAAGSRSGRSSSGPGSRPTRPAAEPLEAGGLAGVEAGPGDPDAIPELEALAAAQGGHIDGGETLAHPHGLTGHAGGRSTLRGRARRWVDHLALAHLAVPPGPCGLLRGTWLMAWARRIRPRPRRHVGRAGLRAPSAGGLDSEREGSRRGRRDAPLPCRLDLLDPLGLRGAP